MQNKNSIRKTEGRLSSDYSTKVRQVATMLLDMLDKALNNLEDKHKTGSPYWRRLRVRKRLTQTILTVAGESDWAKIREQLTEEFFKSSDKELLK